jgi:hypothetical protein
MKILFLILFCCSSVFAEVVTVQSIRNSIRDNNVRTMDEFISKLPADLLKNFTLMHDSKSLHGSSYEEPRALLFGKTGQWVVSFNGSASQAAGNMVEMMIYDPFTKTYAFHELDFSKETPVLHESPSKCLACHGSIPRPIWDHYNNWPGAYGAVDDRYTEKEYEYLTAFIKKAPTHPRYKHLKNLKEGYTLSRPGIRDGLTERSLVNRNRDMNIVLNQQRMHDVATELMNHNDFQKIKPLLFYFLSKCYMPMNSTYQGDGQIAHSTVVDEVVKSIAAGRDINHPYPFQPEQFLDYVFSRLEVDTSLWYINSRDLETYKIFRDGSERLHESFINEFLPAAPEYADYYSIRETDYQIKKIRQAFAKNKSQACADLKTEAMEAVKVLRKPLPDVNTPDMTMNGERVCSGSPIKCRIIYRNLPSICLKCHTQQPGGGKIYIPFHEFPERVEAGNKFLTEKMYHYITTGRMPMRTGGDAAAFKKYSDNDYPKLKKYLEELLK